MMKICKNDGKEVSACTDHDLHCQYPVCVQKKNIEPISPKDVSILKTHIFPDFVFTEWNNAIARNYNGKKSTILRKNMRDSLQKAAHEHKELISDDYFRIEDVYHANGWDVKFTSPEYTESFDSYYEFTPVKK